MTNSGTKCAMWLEFQRILLSSSRYIFGSLRKVPLQEGTLMSIDPELI